MISPKPKGRLLLLSQLFYPEMISSGRNFTELAVALQQAGWEIKVFCAQPAALLGETNASLPALLEYNGIQIRRCRRFGRQRRI